MAVGSEFTVNTTTAYFQEAVQADTLSNGHVVAVWEDWSSHGGSTYNRWITAQIFDEDGAKIGGEITVNTSQSRDQWTPEVTGLSNGNFVVTWRGEYATSPSGSGVFVDYTRFNWATTDYTALHAV